MTTIKTPLPNKAEGNVISMNDDGTDIVQMTGTDAKINQLIDCIAELREAMEGKMDKLPFDTASVSEVATLKETLLGEISELTDYGIAGQSFTIKRSDVEAIINRLIP